MTRLFRNFKYIPSAPTVSIASNNIRTSEFKSTKTSSYSHRFDVSISDCHLSLKVYSSLYLRNYVRKRESKIFRGNLTMIFRLGEFSLGRYRGETRYELCTRKRRLESSYGEIPQLITETRCRAQRVCIWKGI